MQQATMYLGKGKMRYLIDLYKKKMIFKACLMKSDNNPDLDLSDYEKMLEELDVNKLY